MDTKEDKRRYFIIGSVFLEVVTPLFQQKLEEKYQALNFKCLKDFLDSMPVIHILFHLRHRNSECCTDKEKCINHDALPLNHYQWQKLFVENPKGGIHNCFCKYTGRSVKSEDLDLSLCGLLLFNCCNLDKLERDAIHILRNYKNDYLSHNTTCGITKDEYGPLMDELKTNILQLDQTKQDELIRIQRRPLDDALCNKYITTLLDIHEMIEKIDSQIEISTKQILDKLDICNEHQYLTADIKADIPNAICQSCREKLQGIQEQPIKSYKLGQLIFTLNHQTDLTQVIGGDWRLIVSDIVMMDDGRLVMCLPSQERLLICYTDGAQHQNIHVQEKPWRVTAVNNTTVAIIPIISQYIQMYNINTKLKIKLISVPEMRSGDITTINNKLVVDGEYKLLIIDHQIGEVVQTITTVVDTVRLHGSGVKIFYNDIFPDNHYDLHWYSCTDERHYNLTLPSPPYCMTTLQDGSMCGWYVGMDQFSMCRPMVKGTKLLKIKA
ncbi:unnamed protein product [Mytilus edulis]|uniref:DZIP3-like HEPN domain-containing protein n=1 Tax=Mytilus edulis TaxID=6550 RepID=A0A8S3SAW2_MYTED|nr:unnamed protein product [Mytilus edulis]